MINLDGLCINPATYWAFWNEHKRATMESRIALFGEHAKDKGAAKATKAYANYAANKATAMECRLRGDIQGALMYERICDNIYNALPDFAKW